MSISPGFVSLRNGETLPIAKLQEMAIADFRDGIIAAVDGGLRVAALFGDVPAASGDVLLYAVLADAAHALLHVGKTRLRGDRLSLAHAGLPAGPSLRAGDRRTVRHSSRWTSLAQAGPLSCFLSAGP